MTYIKHTINGKRKVCAIQSAFLTRRSVCDDEIEIVGCVVCDHRRVCCVGSVGGTGSADQAACEHQPGNGGVGQEAVL